MHEAYTTIMEPAEGSWKDRGSSFYALALPTQTPEEVSEALSKWTAAHRGARHHAWAYRMYVHGILEERSHDAGEPSHSAGTPILHALQSRELKQCAVLVSRYFGGVKLGVPGLIAAYRGAAEDALDHAARILRHPERFAELELPYELLGRMESDALEESIRWTERAFADRVTLRVAVWAERTTYWEQRWNQYYPLTWCWITDP
ncbi:MAG: YigZ family protein [Cryomorphaceae bacterium]|nr:YigZ family protein [Cryomorphaceae bacterium]